MNGKQVYVGVIAQEVAAIVPDAVELTPDGYFVQVIYPRLGRARNKHQRYLPSGPRRRTCVSTGTRGPESA